MRNCSDNITVVVMEICQGTINKLTQLASEEEHYRNLKRMYEGCEIVLGNLEITYMEHFHNLTFLKVSRMTHIVLVQMKMRRKLLMVVFRKH
uniref:Uncharacterized protein n=1 Tax=Sphaerodactylus townsendi TaxID=933632 RepID=A0ACB8FTX0_9SAUR